MTGRIIRKLGSILYEHPTIPEDVARNGAFGQLKVALVADNFTSECLSEECRIRSLTPDNFREIIAHWNPDIVFVESAFHGIRGSWRYELAKQPKWLRISPPAAIHNLVDFAKEHGIPTIFWNKDDGAFFDSFIDIAKKFDYIFTTDHECVDKYILHVPKSVPVSTLIMPYQPAFHDFTGFCFERHEACFTGSYYRRILDERRRFLDLIFDVCESTSLRLNVFDRNHDRFSRHFEFRFPKNSQIHIHNRVPHRDTARIYKSHHISLNVNSITGSETMFSRRLVEILACGGIAVTNPSRSVDKYFRDFCHVVSTYDEAKETLNRLRSGPSKSDLEKAYAGAEYVKNNHTWTHRLQELNEIVNF